MNENPFRPILEKSSTEYEQSINAHANKVQHYILKIIKNLTDRGIVHDKSKLVSPEREAFKEVTPKLKHSTYGSEEYRATLKSIKPAIEHHNKVNDHHPEHFKNGISGMGLVELVELVCDWKASSERHADGDIVKSIKLNQKRFGYSDDVKQILLNTLKDLEEKGKEN